MGKREILLPRQQLARLRCDGISGGCGGRDATEQACTMDGTSPQGKKSHPKCQEVQVEKPRSHDGREAPTECAYSPTACEAQRGNFIGPECPKESTP